MKKWIVCLLAINPLFSLPVPAFAWPTIEEVIYHQILKACQTQSHEEALNQVLAEYGELAQSNYENWKEFTAEPCANATVPPDPSGVKGQCTSEYAETEEEFDTSNLTWRDCWLEVTETKILFKTLWDTTAIVGTPSRTLFIASEYHYNFPEAMGENWDQSKARGYCELIEEETICTLQLTPGRLLHIFKLN